MSGGKDKESITFHGKQMNVQRNIFIDATKGVAIILVVLGHCIQYGSRLSVDNLYFSDPLFKAIYSFHMPLFMLVSGYLFYYSIKRHSIKYNIKTRFSRLIIPILSWNTIYLAITALPLVIRGETSVFHLVLSYPVALWFLWSIFWCSLITLFVSHILRDSLWAYVLLGIAGLLIPSLHTYGVCYHVFMYPYFVFGYIWNKYRLQRIAAKIGGAKGLTVFCVLLVLYLALYSHYGYEDYIYTTGTCILNRPPRHLIDTQQLAIDIYRYAMGFLGSALMLVSVHKLISIIALGGVFYQRLERKVLVFTS